MKKTVCFLTMGWVLLSNLCFSQTYTKIPIDSNYYWRQLSTCSYHYLIHYEKDTLVAGNIYNKYSQFGPSKGSQPCPNSFIKHGYLRQDTLAKKVFILDNSFLEQPLYNFSKTNIGDTMQMYNASLNTVITVTIAGFGIGAQAQVIDGPDYSNILVQGIGSIIGGLFGHGQKLSGELTEKLICMARLNPFLFIASGSYSHSSYDSCDFPTGLDNGSELKDNALSIFPNPVKEKLNIENYLDKAELNLYNTLGESLIFQEVIVGKQQVDLGSLPCGMYYLKIRNEQDYYTIKILKE